MPTAYVATSGQNRPARDVLSMRLRSTAATASYNQKCLNSRPGCRVAQAENDRIRSSGGFQLAGPRVAPSFCVVLLGAGVSLTVVDADGDLLIANALLPEGLPRWAAGTVRAPR